MVLNRKTTTFLTISATALALTSLFNQEEAPIQSAALAGTDSQIASVDFWTWHQYAPLKKPESVTYRNALVRRFLQKNGGNHLAIADLCTAHSLALLEEKFEETYPEETADKAAERLFLTLQVMLLCSRGDKPEIY